MKRIIFLLTAVFFGFSIVIAQNADEKKDQKKADKKEEKSLIEKHVQSNDQKLIKFSIKAKIDSLIDLYSPGCYYIKEYGKRIDGREEVQKKISADYKSGLKITEMSLSADDIKVYGDMVLEIGVMTVKYTNSSNSVSTTEKSNYQILWKKSSDGKYRIRSQISSPIANPCK
jgi:ketosteroid isomerase-like protein